MGIAFDKITVSEIMSNEVTSVSPQERIIHARRIMLESKVGRLPVIEDEKLVGMLTSKDLMRAFIDFRKNVPEKYQKSQTKLTTNSLVKNKSSFARGGRRQLVSASYSPGPEYNINLYSFNSIEEIKEIFSNKKSRFNKKIFTNKIGPVLFNDRSGKDDKANKRGKSIQYNIIKGGLYNKPINGFSFGTVKGKLNLLQKRKDLRQKRYIDFQENVDSCNNSPLSRKPLKLSKDEEYFENALKRKNNLYENDIKEKQLKLSKIIALHHENLKKIDEEKKK